MLWPLSETLELIEPHIPDQLVSPEAFSHVKTIASLLPAAMSSYYVECRLAVNTTQVDFLTCVAAPDGGRDILVGQSAKAGLPDIFLAHPLWHRAYDFFRQWADLSSALHEQIPLLWMEFDQVDGPLPEVPLPSFSFCLDPLYADRRSWAQYVNSRDPQKRCQVAEKGLQLLFGGPLSPQRKKRSAGQAIKNPTHENHAFHQF